ncbi:MAG: DUF3037 domain-containing protein [Bacteroidota bacterium]
MPDKVTYEYAVIRLVPKVEREEFLNIGVVVFSKRKRYLDLKYQIDEIKVQAFAPHLDLRIIQDELQAWADVCQGAPKGGKIGEQELPYRFRWLTANRSTIIQSSKVHPGLCDDPTQVLESLFELYVI